MFYSFDEVKTQPGQYVTDEYEAIFYNDGYVIHEINMGGVSKLSNEPYDDLSNCKFKKITQNSWVHLFENLEEMFTLEEKPIKLSELLSQAIADIQKCQEYGMQISMDSWITDTKNTCQVCLAGSWLVQSNNFQHTVDNLNDIPKHLQKSCIALDDIRKGFIRQAFRKYYSCDSNLLDFSIPNYRNHNHDYFISVMDMFVRMIAQEEKKLGLDGV